MDRDRIVSREEWLAARKALLAKEKALTRHRDEVAAERRRLPVVRIDKPYIFEGPNGQASLADLFDGRRQLLIYHFMFGPDWSEGCSGCSHMVDNIGHLEHLHARDTTLILVSRAPWAKIAPFKARMGWMLPWYSSFGSDFNYDFHTTTDEAVAPVEYNYQDKATLERKGETYHIAGEQPAVSAFVREDGEVFHSYTTYGRGMDVLVGTYTWLDHTLYGRQETWEDSPPGWPRSDGWERHRDKYE